MLRKILTTTLLSISLSLTAPAVFAAEYSLAIQPILPQKQLQENFQPLAEYLSKVTGHTITISTHRNFLFYWTKMRKKKPGFDLVLDAAHFTDYRTKVQGYTVLAKLPDTVSFSIITSEDNFILDTEELIGLRIATMPSPSLGSLRLEELFPNPMRIPHYEWEANTTIAIEKLRNKQVDAAIIPTRLASTYDEFNVVMTTDSVPHMALSASPAVPEDVMNKIRKGLVDAQSTPLGKRMLQALKIDKFDAADNSTYDGYAQLLSDVFGYDGPKKQVEQ